MKKSSRKPSAPRSSSRTKGAPQYSAPALEKGLDIIELLAGAERGSSLSELASALGRTRNEIFRMLTCLEDRGYIARKDGDDRYQITARLFELAHRHPPTADLMTLAMPVLRDLATRSHQSSQMGMQHEGSVLIIAQVDAPGLVGVAMRVGARRELTNSASGISLLAFQEPSVREEWLRSAGAKRWSPARRRMLERMLQRVARQGYVEYPNPAVKGVLGVSSPVCDHREQAIATVTASFAQLSGDHPSLQQVRRMVMASAAEITHEVGGSLPFAKTRSKVRSR